VPALHWLVQLLVDTQFAFGKRVFVVTDHGKGASSAGERFFVEYVAGGRSHALQHLYVLMMDGFGQYVG
jgi:hypothetical protein